MQAFDLPTDISRAIFKKAVELRNEDVQHSIRLAIFDVIDALFKNECPHEIIQIPGGCIKVVTFYTDVTCYTDNSIANVYTTHLEFSIGSNLYALQYTVYGNHVDGETECCMGISGHADKYTNMVCDVMKQYFPNGIIYCF